MNPDVILACILYFLLVLLAVLIVYVIDLLFQLRHDLKTIDYCVELLYDHDIDCVVENDTTGHIIARKKSDGQLMEFWVSSGKIAGEEKKKGVMRFIKLLEE